MKPTLLSDDFVPSKEMATRVGMSAYTFEAESEFFRIYHEDKGTEALSWPGRWRTWCCNWKRNGSRQSKPPVPPRTDGFNFAAF